MIDREALNLWVQRLDLDNNMTRKFVFTGMCFMSICVSAGKIYAGSKTESKEVTGEYPEKALLLFMAEFDDIDEDAFDMLKERGEMDVDSEALPHASKRTLGGKAVEVLNEHDQ